MTRPGDSNDKIFEHAISAHQLRLEETKLWFEYHKHMTTLNTGVIIIVATLLEKVFTNITPQDFNLIAISFYSFIVSTMISVIGLGYHLPSLRLVTFSEGNTGANRIVSSLKYVRVLLMTVSMLSFLAGIVTFINFSLTHVSATVK